MTERFTKSENSLNSEVHPNREGFKDGLPTAGRFHRALVSGVREILRNYNVDMIPHVQGFIYSSMPNEWGDIYIIVVQYAKRGYRAVYGGRYETADDGISTKIVWRCYMD